MSMKIMVLNDGETWTDLDGCKIVEVTPREVADAMAESRTPVGKTRVEFTEHVARLVNDAVLSISHKLTRPE